MLAKPASTVATLAVPAILLSLQAPAAAQELVLADAAGTAATTLPIAAAAGVSAGDVKRYQYRYRTTQHPPCGAGVNDFNLSNGYEVLWGP